MTNRHFENGKLQLACKDSRLSLSLSSSFTLALPPLPTEPTTAADIAQLSKTGELWIAKAISCRLETTSSVEGTDLDARAARTCIDSITDCSLWGELGLRLRPDSDEADPTASSPAQSSFVVNHPDLSSEFLAPPGIPCAIFQTLTCTFELHTKRLKRTATAPGKWRRRSIRYNLRDNDGSSSTPDSLPLDDAVEPPNYSLVCPEPVPLQNHTLDPETAMVFGNQTQYDTILDCLRDGRDLSLEDTQQQGADGIHGPYEWKDDISTLVTAALYKLIGVKKRNLGVRTTAMTAKLPMADVAPAVWNLQHLQSLASRMELVPTIVSALAGLAHAQSPAIRAKIRGLMADSLPENEEAHIYTSIHERMSLLAHMGLDVQPVPRPKKKNGIMSTSQEEIDLTEPSLPMTELEESQYLTQGAEVDDEIVALPMDICDDGMGGETSWDSGLALTPAEDEDTEVDEQLFTSASATELTMDMSSQDKMMVDECGGLVCREDSEDEYDYVYEIVPVAEQTDVQDGLDERWSLFNNYGEFGSSVQEPRDRTAWCRDPLVGYDNNPSGYQMQLSHEFYGADEDFGDGDFFQART